MTNTITILNISTKIIQMILKETLIRLVIFRTLELSGSRAPWTSEMWSSVDNDLVYMRPGREVSWRHNDSRWPRDLRRRRTQPVLSWHRANTSPSTATTHDANITLLWINYQSSTTVFYRTPVYSVRQSQKQQVSNRPHFRSTLNILWKPVDTETEIASL